MERPTAPCAGCWLHVTQPTKEDLATVREFGVPDAMLDHIADIDERPRVEHADECVLVVMNYPLRRDEKTGPPWRTLPLSVLLTPQGIVTLSQATTPFLQPSSSLTIFCCRSAPCGLSYLHPCMIRESA